MAEENTPEPGELPKDPELSPSDETPPVVAPAAGAIAPTGMPSAGLTPGQRLAAKKAQKAVDKRDAREERRREEEETRQREQAEAERLLGRAPPEPVLPQNVERAAGTFTHFLQENRTRIVGAVLGALALTGIGFGVQRLMRAGAVEQAVLLRDALEIENAGLDPEDTDGKADDGKPVFKTEQERATAALAAFEKTASADKDRDTGRWAQLGAAANEAELGKLAEARKRFQGVYDASEGASLKARALEGVGITLEGEGKQDEALKTYEQLRTLEGSAPLADFHIARLKLAKGDQEGGKQLLKSLYDTLGKPSEDSAPHTYLRNEVEVRLAEIDSSLVTGAGGLGGMGGSPQVMDEAQIQRLIEQLSKKGKAGAGAE